MGSWMFDERDYYTGDGESAEYEEYSAEDALADLYEAEMEKILEERAFGRMPKHGKFAHAYKHDIVNGVIIQLRGEGKTLREIAERFECSPSTIRNRLKIMGMR